MLKPRLFNDILIKFNNHLRWAVAIIWCLVWCHFVCFECYAVANLPLYLFHILRKLKSFVKTLRQLILCFILNNSLDVYAVRLTSTCAEIFYAIVIETNDIYCKAHDISQFPEFLLLWNVCVIAVHSYLHQLK